MSRQTAFSIGQADPVPIAENRAFFEPNPSDRESTTPVKWLHRAGRRHQASTSWQRTCNLALQILAVGAALCASQTGHAQSQTPPAEAPLTVSFGQSLEDWLTQPTMTGDWGGLRTTLVQDGFNFRASYIGEYAYNFSGGKRIGGDYAQQIAFGVDVDMGKVAGLTGGTFHLSFNVREGRNTTADYIGNKIDVQEIYGGRGEFSSG